MCVCVWVCLRERERESVCVCVCMRECVCVCVCVFWGGQVCRACQDKGHPWIGNVTHLGISLQGLLGGHLHAKDGDLPRLSRAGQEVGARLRWNQCAGKSKCKASRRD